MNPPVVDHIGIIVEDLDQALKLFENLYGLRPAARKDMPEVGLRIAHLKAANIDLELLQYTGAEGGFAEKTMGRRPGVNHFSVRVEDVDEAVARFGDNGVRVMEGFPRQGSHGRVAFFEPDTADGVLMEACEAEAQE